MPLTRHLYEIDEVISALQLQDDSALFWLWELIVSHEEQLARSTWDLYIPADWVTQYEYAKIARNLLEKAQKPTKRTYERPDLAAIFVSSLAFASTNVEEAREFWLGLDDACARKNMIAVAWYLKTTELPSHVVWTALAQIDPAIPQWSGAVTSQIAAIWKRFKGDPDITASKAKWAQWDSMIGRRKARVYAIPEAALTSKTTRGSLLTKYTNIADIREPVGLLSEGCKFWQGALQAAGITTTDETVSFPNDEVLEKFYEEFFPDDIPDEWSTVDQQKSHGRGRLKA
jgi:hypothetical protein